MRQSRGCLEMRIKDLTRDNEQGSWPETRSTRVGRRWEEQALPEQALSGWVLRASEDWVPETRGVGRGSCHRAS
jgi:hypothetical protein